MSRGYYASLALIGRVVLSPDVCDVIVKVIQLKRDGKKLSLFDEIRSLYRHIVYDCFSGLFFSQKW
jgi:hypothetical protein